MNLLRTFFVTTKQTLQYDKKFLSPMMDTCEYHMNGTKVVGARVHSNCTKVLNIIRL
jgi:hypothetical protein